MRRIRFSRPSPAMVVALLALFVSLAGSALAASGGISGAINGTTIKQGSLPGDRLRRGTVTGDRLAKHTLTGAQVNVAKLGTVPKAQSAASVGGLTTKRVQVKVATNGAATRVLSLGGLTLTATCPGGRPILEAKSATNHSLLRGHFVSEAQSTAGNTNRVLAFGASDVNATDTTAMIDTTLGSSRRGDVLFTYAREHAPGVRGSLYADDTHTLGNFNGCLFDGDATLG